MPHASYENLLETRIKELEDAIRKHRDARGHDRCWENDLELYAHLKDKKLPVLELPPHDEFISKCEEYYECLRQKKAGDKS